MELCQPPRKLTPFSYVILALVGRGGAGPHDIVRMMRQGAQFWSTSESHYYAEPKRLATLGFLSARTEPGRTRPRTHYELTDKGAEALRAWLAEPAAMPRVQHEGDRQAARGRLLRRRHPRGDPGRAWAPSSTRPKRNSTRSWSAFPTCPTAHATYG